jgi:glycosyltransferase involved in cell wall biosynthesis
MAESVDTIESGESNRLEFRAKSNSPSLTVAIPALNEERNIESTVRAVLEAAVKTPGLTVEILVIDDGSTDGTAEIVLNLAQRCESIRLVRNPRNLGLGASLRRAIDAAAGEKILFIPGDNDIPAVTLDMLFRNAYAAEVVMCYFHNEESRGRLRFLVSTLFMLVYTTCFDLYVQYLNGPAIYPVERLRRLELHSTRFSIVAEINVKLLRGGVTFVELPSNRQTGLDGSTSFGLVSLIETVRVFFQVLLDVYARHREKYAYRPVRLPYELSLSIGAQEAPNNRR